MLLLPHLFKQQGQPNRDPITTGLYSAQAPSESFNTTAIQTNNMGHHQSSNSYSLDLVGEWVCGDGEQSLLPGAGGKRNGWISIGPLCLRGYLPNGLVFLCIKEPVSFSELAGTLEPFICHSATKAYSASWADFPEPIRFSGYVHHAQHKLMEKLNHFCGQFSF